MKNNLFIITVALLLSGCSKTKSDHPLKLEILNKKLNSFSEKSNKDTINQIRFKVTNTSNTIYYFNNIYETPMIINGLFESGKVIKIFNDGKEISYKDVFLHKFNKSSEYCSFQNLRLWALNAKRLGYKELPSFAYTMGTTTNFFIHPDETLYFEYYLNISDTIKDDNFRLGFANLKIDKKYYATLSLASDTTNARKNLPRNILQTIKANNAKIYYGVLTSNKIPVKVINASEK